MQDLNKREFGGSSSRSWSWQRFYFFQRGRLVTCRHGPSWPCSRRRRLRLLYLMKNDPKIPGGVCGTTRREGGGSRSGGEPLGDDPSSRSSLRARRHHRRGDARARSRARRDDRSGVAHLDVLPDLAAPPAVRFQLDCGIDWCRPRTTTPLRQRQQKVDEQPASLHGQCPIL